MPSQASGNLATTLGRNIRIARDERGLTQRELATMIDAESMQVSKWERGKHRPSDENLIALARALNFSLGWFYTDHEAVAA